jgi:hypothetical protein
MKERGLPRQTGCSYPILDAPLASRHTRIMGDFVLTNAGHTAGQGHQSLR